MPGLSQLELDAISSACGSEGAPPSPQDSCLRKRRHRVSLSAMTAEMKVLAKESEESSANGISQAELDSLAVTSTCESRSSSPISSFLLQVKRSRPRAESSWTCHRPAGAGGAAARAAEIVTARVPTGGLTQEELDAITCRAAQEDEEDCQGMRTPLQTLSREQSTSRSPARKGSKRRNRRLDENSCTPIDENQLKLQKDLGDSPEAPGSPVRRAMRVKVKDPLSPLN
eukprot:TRINITY_DN3843_c0_g1_i5.p1 TRINITY_DN3843_c0_g1~~TRINITY_DN3843_c0_g1_i5.p1  ORF type:complete len:228 (-),score=50.76 TRINITY_DN3843_c0_g1_i5:149-832(-)